MFAIGDGLKQVIVNEGLLAWAGKKVQEFLQFMLIQITRKNLFSRAQNLSSAC